MKLLRRVTHSLQYLLTKNTQRFGQAASQHEEDEPTKQTKHNPHAIKDLRGYEHLEDAKESQKNFTNFHSTQINKLSAYYAFSFFLPNAYAAFIGTFAPHPQTAIASDSLNLPKIFPEAVPVYDSIHKTGHSIIANKFYITLGPAFVLFLSPEPFMTLFFSAGAWGIYYTLRYKYAKDIVLKLELLPNTQQIAYQKINFFGQIVTKKARISDLEQFDLYEKLGERDYSERAVRGILNRDVTFRIKGTGQLILFDKNGVWHEQGINHELLV